MANHKVWTFMCVLALVIISVSARARPVLDERSRFNPYLLGRQEEVSAPAVGSSNKTEKNKVSAPGSTSLVRIHVNDGAESEQPSQDNRLENAQPQPQMDPELQGYQWNRRINAFPHLARYYKSLMKKADDEMYEPYFHPDEKRANYKMLKKADDELYEPFFHPDEKRANRPLAPWNVAKLTEEEA